MPLVGEIRMMANTYAPVGWAFCDGRSLPIAENEVLFTVIGTTYGGDGEETFNLPNMESRVPIHRGTGPDGTSYQLGEMGGTEQVTVTVQQIPNHTHPLLGSLTLGSSPDPGGNVLAQSRVAGKDMYLEDDPSVSLSPNAVTPAGGSQPHENMQPFLCINFIISLFGEFPREF